MILWYILGLYLNLRASTWKQEKPSLLILAISCNEKNKKRKKIREEVSGAFIPSDQDFISPVRICGQKSVFHPATGEVKTGESKASLRQALIFILQMCYQYLLLTFLKIVMYVVPHRLQFPLMESGPSETRQG